MFHLFIKGELHQVMS